MDVFTADTCDFTPRSLSFLMNLDVNVKKRFGAGGGSSALCEGRARVASLRLALPPIHPG